MAAPIKYTCPDIDRYIKDLKHWCPERRNDIEDWFTVEELKELCYNLINSIDDCCNNFEDIRDANDILRTWGTSMEEKFETLQVQYNELEEKYNALLEENQLLKQ